MRFEIWKDIPGYEDYYQVSNFGNVKSLDRYVVYKNGTKVFYKGKNLTLHKNKKGYIFIQLHKNNTWKNFSLHVLVAQAFVENPYNLPEVNHKDGNKQNNIDLNLEWVTRQENMQHAADSNLLETGIYKAIKLNQKAIAQFKGNNFIREYSSLKEACLINNYDYNYFCKRCKKNKSAYGYLWRYI